MPIILLASQVPLPMAPSGTVQPNNSSSLTADTVSPGDTFISGPITNNGLRSDLIARWGAGFYAVLSGLALSAGTGLNASVSAGSVLCDGIVGKSDASTVPLNASTRNHIWLQRDGSFDVRTTLTQPAIPAVYLGSALCDGSGVTSVDSSGVFSFFGGWPIRETADEGEPLDAPASTLSFATRTAEGLYPWTGDAYEEIEPGVHTETLTGDLTLLVTDSRYQMLTPSGADRSVTLPSTVRARKGFAVSNAATAGSYNLVVKDSGGAVLACLANGESAWVEPTFGAAAGASGKYLVRTVKQTIVEANSQSGTTYTLALTDMGKSVDLTNAAAITLTIPPNSSVAFPVGTIVNLYQGGAGQVTVSPDTGVTLRSHGAKYKLSGQYAGAVLRKIGADEWVLAGNVSA